MKGLLKNQFYGAMDSALILLAIFTVFGIGVWFLGYPSLLTVYVLVPATAFALNVTAGFRKEAASKWDKYELATPVKRKDIVKSRYISHFVWVLAGIILSGILVGLTVVRHGNIYFDYIARDPLTIFFVAGGVAVLTGTIFYPVVYIWGADKSEMAIIISLTGAIGGTFGIVWLLNAAYDFRPLSDSEYYLVLTIYMVLVLISFILSYFFTTYIYKRKDY